MTNISSLALERMRSVVLDRFEEVSLLMNGKLETMTTSEEYEVCRQDLYKVFDDLTLGLSKIDKCSTNKEFDSLAALFPSVIDDLTEALKDYFSAYLYSVYESVKGDLK